MLWYTAAWATRALLVAVGVDLACYGAGLARSGATSANSAGVAWFAARSCTCGEGLAGGHVGSAGSLDLGDAVGWVVSGRHGRSALTVGCTGVVGLKGFHIERTTLGLWGGGVGLGRFVSLVFIFHFKNNLKNKFYFSSKNIFEM